MRTVLFVVYYFPPMGSSGVQRPLKFIKYLPEYGWKPIVLTPEAGAYHTFDKSLEEDLDHPEIEVIRVPAKTVFHRAGKAAKKAAKAPDGVRRMLRWISNFFMLPDNKRGWIEPGLRQAEEVINKRDIDALVSTAPPYSNHIIAQKIKNTLNIPTLLDFRDDWLESHLIQYPTPLHRARMRRMEQQALESADAVVAINDAMLDSLRGRGPDDVDYRVIPQGFDPEDFSSESKATLDYEDGCVNLLYSGIFYNENQPDQLLEAAARLLKRRSDLRGKLVLHFQGRLDERHQRMIERLGLENWVRYYGYQPHQTAVQNLKVADALWLVANFHRNPEQVVTGKLYEYIGAGKPILGLVLPGEARRILEQYRGSYLAKVDDSQEVEESLEKLVDDGLSGQFKTCAGAVQKQYDRQKLAGDLAEILNKISGYAGIDG